MKWFLKLLVFVLAISPFGAIQAKDIVSAQIVLDFDKTQFKIAEPAPYICPCWRNCQALGMDKA
jgi:hypothetical protein